MERKRIVGRGETPRTTFREGVCDRVHRMITGFGGPSAPDILLHAQELKFNFESREKGGGGVHEKYHCTRANFFNAKVKKRGK